MLTMLRLRLLVVPLLIAAGCTHPRVASNELPLQRVVIYRNGVGYFERGGEVRSERVEFKVDRDHVSDFLATLSVMERGGSSVRAASFPISTGDEQTPGPEGAEGSAGPSSLLRSRDIVALELDGEKHDLLVGYVAPQPVWRPSYRLVFDGEKPSLQAWGIVQNISGEDWTDVSLSLVAGAPIAFRADLATPTTPDRPSVTDHGEMIAAVPQGETTLAQQPTEPAPAAEAYGDELGDYDQEEYAEQSKRKKTGRAPAAPKAAPAPAPRRQAPAPPPPAYTSAPVQRGLSLLAAAQVQGGATRYDLPEKVTIPDQSATMVLLTAREVPGEQVFLFAPEGGVGDSARHPFRVVRFTNDGGGLMERGPIAVFEEGAFLGQGMLESLPAGAEATVPFALERGIGLASEAKSEEKDARIARIEAGILVLERDQALLTTWRVQNGLDKPARVLIRHPRQHAYRLVGSPKGTEDRVAQGSALVPVEVPAKGKLEPVIDERRAYQTQVDWMSPVAEQAVKAFLADKARPRELVTALEAAWVMREKLRKTNEDIAKLEAERGVLQNAAYGARASLQSIERSRGVQDLRKKLGARLAELETQLSDVTQKLVEAQLQANELRVRFQEAVRELKYDASAAAA